LARRSQVGVALLSRRRDGVQVTSGRGRSPAPRVLLRRRQRPSSIEPASGSHARL